jgi:hypothetical protein
VGGDPSPLAHGKDAREYSLVRSVLTGEPIRTKYTFRRFVILLRLAQGLFSISSGLAQYVYGVSTCPCEGT